jgi:hypothetical protein
MELARFRQVQSEFASQIRFSEWPVRCGTEPERLAGRLAPSVFDLVDELSRIVLRPVVWLCHQLSKGEHPAVRMCALGFRCGDNRRKITVMDLGIVLFVVDWIIVAVGAIGAVFALIAMVRHQYH